MFYKSVAVSKLDEEVLQNIALLSVNHTQYPKFTRICWLYVYSLLSQGSREPWGKGPGPLKIQWGPCEILPEGPMDPPKLENS